MSLPEPSRKFSSGPVFLPGAKVCVADGGASAGGALVGGSGAKVGPS